MKVSVLAAAMAASAVAFTAVPAAAQTEVIPNFYGNLGYTFLDGGDGVNLGAATARVGVRLHRYFGAEAEGALGVDGDRSVVLGSTVRTKLKHSIGAYAVGFLPVTPQLELFARGGYGASRIRVSTPTVRVSDSEDSWNYGAGAQYLFDAKNGVRAEYTRHDFGKGSGDVDAWSVSFVRKF
jgi:opacity protein-like surface antigen